MVKKSLSGGDGSRRKSKLGIDAFRFLLYITYIRMITVRMFMSSNDFVYIECGIH